jgi:hypothetical protein
MLESRFGNLWGSFNDCATLIYVEASLRENDEEKNTSLHFALFYVCHLGQMVFKKLIALNINLSLS